MRLLGPILSLATLNFVFIYHDGALFMELTETLGDWIAQRVMESVPE